MIIALVIIMFMLALAAISNIGRPSSSGQQRAIGSVPPRITPIGQIRCRPAVRSSPMADEEPLYARDEQRRTTTFLGMTITDEYAAQLRARGINVWTGHPLAR